MEQTPEEWPVSDGKQNTDENDFSPSRDCSLIGLAPHPPIVKMNHWYGVGIKKAFESEENWYKINAYGGKRLIFWSCVLALIGLVAFFIPIEGKGAEALLIILPLGFAPLLVMIPAIVEMYRFSRKL